MHEGGGGENQEPAQSGPWTPLPDREDQAAPVTPGHQGQPGQAIPGGPPGQPAPPTEGPWGPPSAGGPGGWAPQQAGGQGPGVPQQADGGGQWAQPPGGEQASWGGPPAGGYGQPPPWPPPQQPRRGGRALVYLLVAVLAATTGAGAVLAFQARSTGQGSLSARDIPSPGNLGDTNTSTINMGAVAARVEPGVVDITSNLRYAGQVFEGTGIVLSSSGLVLTNNHVVAGSTRLTATLVTSGRKYAAQIVGTDSIHDVALLKLTGASGLQRVQVGDSAKVRLGMPVVALGNAGGTGGPPTVTSGSITALRRTITASNSGSGSSETLHNMLQTNAPIAEGDSGGPLANAAGQVIGMDTAANTQALGGPGTSQGFAIPIDQALAIARQMAAGQAGQGIHLGQPAFLGIAVASTASNAASTAGSPRQQLAQLRQTASQFGSGVDTNRSCLATDAGNPVPGRIAPASSGTLIAGVFCGAPASVTGLRGGDVILALDGHSVSAPTTLTQLLSHYHPGNRVSVTWMDIGGLRHTGSLTLAAGPAK